MLKRVRRGTRVSREYNEMIDPQWTLHFVLLFLQLLRGAFVREHRGDGRKYLIVGDLLAAGQVSHFWETAKKESVIQIKPVMSCFDAASQINLTQCVLFNMLQWYRRCPNAQGQLSINVV